MRAAQGRDSTAIRRALLPQLVHDPDGRPWKGADAFAAPKAAGAWSLRRRSFIADRRLPASWIQTHADPAKPGAAMAAGGAGALLRVAHWEPKGPRARLFPRGPASTPPRALARQPRPCVACRCASAPQIGSRRTAAAGPGPLLRRSSVMTNRRLTCHDRATRPGKPSAARAAGAQGANEMPHRERAEGFGVGFCRTSRGMLARPGLRAP